MSTAHETKKEAKRWRAVHMRNVSPSFSSTRSSTTGSCRKAGNGTAHTRTTRRGASPFDTQALYNTSLWLDSTKWLELLHACDESTGNVDRWNAPANGKFGWLDYLLGNAIDRDHVRRIEWLLAHGANPRARHVYSKRNLHTNADPGIRNSEGRTAADESERIGMDALAQLVRDAENA